MRQSPAPQATGEFLLRAHNASFVYYGYDASGDLLYIGVTDDLAQRIQGHRRGGSAWIKEAAKVTWERYPSRLIAEKVEERQIRALLPKYNETHNWRRIEADEMGLRFLPDELAWQRLGRRFRVERTRQRLSQRVIAQRCGADVEDVRALERGIRDRYAKAFLEGVETALDWRPGSVEAVLSGDEQHPYTKAELEERAFAEARRMTWGEEII
jgi:predicted GIY-YIG superfamily endonuclease/transcriptional regulator with XRE-family HTH domain